jgi:hypothetical protein
MEGMEKQTAVELLEEELKLNLKKVILEGNSKLIESLFEQANEMFEQKIKDAWNDGHFEITGCIDAEQYYKETYGKDNIRV